MSQVARRIAVCLLLWTIAGAVSAADPLMPFESKQQHLGVATCAGSNCHGSSRPFDDSPVLQNEYFLWQREDAHSNAFKLLQGAAGQRIARNLGIKDATQAQECLTCHTDYVAKAQQGRRYSVAEGVACEACHGGAQEWLGPHVSGNTHAQNLQAGLYPLEDPVARARLCLQCHLGTGNKPIDHRIMGAGHPPLEFELDTFTNIQPAHFRVDADYLQRKPAHVSGSRLWAIGQLVAAETFLDELSGPRFDDVGLFPELVFFDCTACHHAMRPPRWNPGAGGPLGPGEPRLADAYLAMSGVVLAVLAPSIGEQWQGALTQLHLASRKSVPGIQDTSRQLKALAGRGLDELRNKPISRAQTTALLGRLATLGADQRGGDYSSSKQIFYGLEALLANLKLEHGTENKAVGSQMDRLFAAFDVNAAYDADTVRDALSKIAALSASL